MVNGMGERLAAMLSLAFGGFARDFNISCNGVIRAEIAYDPGRPVIFEDDRIEEFMCCQRDGMFCEGVMRACAGCGLGEFSGKLSESLNSGDYNSALELASRIQDNMTPPGMDGQEWSDYIGMLAEKVFLENRESFRAFLLWDRQSVSLGLLGRYPEQAEATEFSGDNLVSGEPCRVIVAERSCASCEARKLLAKPSCASCEARKLLAKPSCVAPEDILACARECLAMARLALPPSPSRVTVPADKILREPIRLVPRL